MMHPVTVAQLEGQGLMLPVETAGREHKQLRGAKAERFLAHNVETKRGINLGCGRVILPCERPDHHKMIAAELYEDGAYEWDNVDSVGNDGVDKVIDLFDYPWTVISGTKLKARTLIDGDIYPDSTFDVAISAHLCEHIPHAIKRNGKIVDTHGGWWAWWNELGRVLKPGCVAHILAPYGPSRGGFIDPTHTRYLLPETFGYFEENPDAPFDYPLEYEWEALSLPVMGYTQLAWDAAEQEFGEATTETLWKIANKYFGAVAEFAISLRVKK